MAGVTQQGWSQQTAAVRQMIAQMNGARASTSSGRRSKRRKAKSSTASTSSKRSKRSSKRKFAAKAGHLVKGSKQAKAYMAKIRRKRR